MTAGGLFKQHGYHATSMRDIAKSLNLRGSSLYAHIDSKETLLQEIVTQAATQFLNHAKSINPDFPPEQKLELLIRGHLRIIADELPHATVFFHEWRFLPDDFKTNMIAQRDAYEQYFRDTIQDGVNTGVFNVSDVKIASLFVLSSLNWTYQWLDVQGDLSIDALSAQFRTLIFNALGAT